MAPENTISNSSFLSTGITGLDDILSGGLTRDRLYLIEGAPGAGKTTLGLQFLLEGARLGEPVMYITLSETDAEVRATAESHGWSMDGITIHEVIPSEDILNPEEHYTMFHPSEIEMGTTTQDILSAVERLKPKRVVLDSLSELQLLAGSSLRYRRQVLAFKQYFSTRECTVMLLDDRTASGGDLQVRSIAHAVISLEITIKDYGGERRRLRIPKYRGVAFRGGMHDYIISHGGLIVFPRLVSSESRVMAKRAQLSSGLPSFDALLGGGLEEGTSTLVTGPPGTGKSTLAAQIVDTATRQNKKAAMFLFEESTNNFLNRSNSIGMKLQQAMENGLLTIQQIDPAELSPGQFASSICSAADDGAKVIVIDSMNGFLNAMPDERFLTTHLHEILTYLGQRGIVTILVGVQQTMLGGSMATSTDASYLADNVIMLRYFEAEGEVRQAISVFKKRGSQHERTIRQFCISSHGVKVGPVLRNFHGILSGLPTTSEPTSVEGQRAIIE